MINKYLNKDMNNMNWNWEQYDQQVPKQGHE